jgi:hypothetical protein
MENKKTKVKDAWSEKFLREYPFMPLGSMMNAFGNINQGKGMSVEEFERVADKLFELANKYVKQAMNSVEVGMEEKNVADPDFFVEG